MATWVQVDDDGAFAIPADVIASLGWKDGDLVEIEGTDAGIVIKRSEPEVQTPPSKSA